MDITAALAPKSDQLDAIELVTPRTFTIDSGSRLGERDGHAVAEIRLVDFDRVWRPSKGMLDVLAQCWGTDARQWVGRSITLYCDPTVKFGKEQPGGTRISHLSHIDGPRTCTIRASGAGRKQPWKVQPLPDAPQAPEPSPEPTEADVSACDDVGVLRGWYQQSSPERQAQIKARAEELTTDDEVTP